jgi:hypothetical protein
MVTDRVGEAARGGLLSTGAAGANKGLNRRQASRNLFIKQGMGGDGLRVLFPGKIGKIKVSWARFQGNILALFT